MSPNRLVPSQSVSRRRRLTNPRCRGGASSLLRLTQRGAGRLPGAVALGHWMSHAASVLMPVTGPLAAPADLQTGSTRGPR